MRLSHLLLYAFLFVLLLASRSAAAQSQPALQTASVSEGNAFSSDSFLDGSGEQTLDLRQLFRSRNRQERICYTLRAYRVRRADRESDVVEPWGYSSCPRASLFSLKNAVSDAEAVVR